MRKRVRKLAICNFNNPFDGEAGYFELGMLRSFEMASEHYKLLQVNIPDDANAGAAKTASEKPDLIVVHVYRDKVHEAMEFVDRLGELLPAIPVYWCGWTACPPYLDEIMRATGRRFSHPDFALICGEPEATLPDICKYHLQQPARRAGQEKRRKGIAAWNKNEGQWEGETKFVSVDDLTRLPSVSHLIVPRTDFDTKPSGWIEISRGCLNSRCAYCIECAYGESNFRVFPSEKIRAEILSLYKKGVRLFGLLATGINYNTAALRTVVDTFEEIDDKTVEVMGTVHINYLNAENIDLLSRLRWRGMVIGLQTTNTLVQKTINRHTELPEFARKIELIGSFAIPDVELILGLPNDTFEDFRNSVSFALSLRVNVSVYRLRLDPWSYLLNNMGQLRIRADFSRLGTVVSTPDFPETDIIRAENWYNELARNPENSNGRFLYYNGRTP